MRFFLPLVALMALVFSGCFENELCFSPNHCSDSLACVKPDPASRLGRCEEQCSTDAECREGQACSPDGACVATNASKACTTTADCSLYGACVDADGDPSTPERTCTAACISADDCTAGWSCTDLMEQSWTSCLEFCLDDANCREVESCINAACVDNRCTTADDCSFAQACVDDDSDPATSNVCSDTCDSATECPAGYSCLTYGDGTQACSYACFDSNDCRPDEICDPYTSIQCQPAPEKQACTVTEDCAAGEGCLSGRCERSCNRHSDCGEREACVGSGGCYGPFIGYCESYNKGRPCVTASDCAETAYPACVDNDDNAATAKQCMSQCTVSSDCAEGLVCADFGFCEGMFCIAD